MERPVYFCGPPAIQQTISVTRYLSVVVSTRCFAPRVDVMSGYGSKVDIPIGDQVADHDSLENPIPAHQWWGHSLVERRSAALATGVYQGQFELDDTNQKRHA